MFTGKSSERNLRECPIPICRPINEKEISNFGSAQSQKQLESARGRPRSGNDANLSLEKNAFTFNATAEVRSTVQAFFSI